MTSYLTSVVALGVMLSTLAYAPFSHVHSEEGHHGAGEAHGLQVHSHFSFAGQGAGTGAEAGAEGINHPLIDVSSGEGGHIDLFVSLAGKPFSVEVSAESHTDVTPQFQTSERHGARRTGRTRDPPGANVSSRAPPF